MVDLRLVKEDAETVVREEGTTWIVPSKQTKDSGRD